MLLLVLLFVLAPSGFWQRQATSIPRSALRRTSTLRSTALRASPPPSSLCRTGAGGRGARSAHHLRERGHARGIAAYVERREPRFRGCWFWAVRSISPAGSMRIGNRQRRRHVVAYPLANL